MALSYVVYTGDGSTQNFAVPFPYLVPTHVSLAVSDGLGPYSFTWLSAGLIQVTPAPVAASVVVIKRTTPISTAAVTYSDDSTLIADDMNTETLQLLYAEQEAQDRAALSLIQNIYDGSFNFDAQNHKIVNLADATAATDAMNKESVAAAITSAITGYHGVSGSFLGGQPDDASASAALIAAGLSYATGYVYYNTTTNMLRSSTFVHPNPALHLPDSFTWANYPAPIPFTGLSDVPISYSGAALKPVRVNAGATALEFYTPSTPAFTGLSDAPASYSGSALKAVRVNSGATALEFYTPPAVITAFTGLSDAPASYSGAGLSNLRVNAAATAVEFWTWSPSTQTTSYTLALTDADSVVRYNSASAGTITVPPNSSVAFPIGTIIKLSQIGDGVLTVAAGAGVTIENPMGLIFNRRHLSAELRKTATDSWNLSFYGFGARASLPLVAQASVSGAVALDHSKGEVQRLSLTGNVTLSVSNWPLATQLGRLILEITNTGAYGVTSWPSGTIWAGGTAPTITSGSGKKDLVVLTTFDGGTTIYGSFVGQNYS